MGLGNDERLGIARSQGIGDEHDQKVTIQLAEESKLCLAGNRQPLKNSNWGSGLVTAGFVLFWCVGSFCFLLLKYIVIKSNM